MASLANDKDTLPRMDSERVEIRAGDCRRIASLLRAADGLAEALAHSANALADYIPTIEAKGASLNYGRSVQAMTAAALAAWKKAGA
jgi:hypothetical protein